VGGLTKANPFVERVLGLLLPLGPVRSRAMFGGWGLYLDGIMFALIAWDRLFFKVDEENKPRFADAGSVAFTYQGKSKPIEMSYWEAPAGSLEGPEALLPWAESGLAAARRKNAKKKPKARKGRKAGARRPSAR